VSDLWCASCRMDGERVVAIVKIRGVPFCRPCRESYKDEPGVLATVIEWHQAHLVPQDNERIERYVETQMQAVPTGPPVEYKCICQCGGTVAEAGGLLPGHEVKALPRQKIEHRRETPTVVRSSDPLRNLIDKRNVSRRQLERPQGRYPESPDATLPQL
jgi:hypothetical protein